MGEGDGSPHPRGQRMGRRWISASGLQCPGQGLRGNNGWGREDGRWGKGMGPRIREDNGWGGDGFPPGLHGGALRGNRECAGMTGGGARTGGGGRGWVPASARTTDGEGMDFRPPSSRGQALRRNCGGGSGNDGWGREDGRWGKGMGPRIREDNGWGGDGFPPSSSLGTGSTRE